MYFLLFGLRVFYWFGSIYLSVDDVDIYGGTFLKLKFFEELLIFAAESWNDENLLGYFSLLNILAFIWRGSIGIVRWSGWT